MHNVNTEHTSESKLSFVLSNIPVFLLKSCGLLLL